MKNKRVFLIILDSLGIGELPDAASFGDEGANTLKSISESPRFHIPNLIKLGLGNIDGVSCVKKTEKPTAAVARMAEKSQGKDTTIGHWEICGVTSNKPLPTYPDGFPKELVEQFSKLCGKGVLCNKPYSGTEVIKDYGAAHVKSGDLIVYTSADSVFQIAAHEEVVPLEELYRYCSKAREMLTGEHGVGRVIARPFVGNEKEGFKRTANRRDFSVLPPRDTLLDIMKKAELDVIAVGKITDIFAGQGITKSIPTHSNKEGMEVTEKLADTDFCGLCFTNLVEFDMLYGHRNDVDGYAGALSEFDLWLGTFLPKMKENDMLIITADHGCDPGNVSTDHSREYTPLLICSKNIKPENYGTRESFADIGATVAKYFGLKTKGTPIL